MPEYQALTTELLESVHSEGMGASLVSTPAVFSLTVSYMVCETACMFGWNNCFLSKSATVGV